MSIILPNTKGSLRLMRNILITGIPRSGTTLFCSLLNATKECIVLPEPIWIRELRKKAKNCPHSFLSQLNNKISQIRTDVSEGKKIEVLIDKRNKALPKNFFIRKEGGKICSIKKNALVSIPAELFDRPVCIKSNTFFTAILDNLASSKQYEIVAIVRNPIAVIKSWRSLNIPVSRGELKIAEIYSDKVKKTSLTKDLLKKQVKNLDWFYAQYFIHKGNITVVRYEDLIESPSKMVSKVIQNKTPVPSNLISMNNSSHYNHSETAEIENCVNEHAQFYKHFYPQLSVKV